MFLCLAEEYIDIFCHKLLRLFIHLYIYIFWNPSKIFFSRKIIAKNSYDHRGREKSNYFLANRIINESKSIRKHIYHQRKVPSPPFWKVLDARWRGYHGAPPHSLSLSWSLVMIFSVLVIARYKSFLWILMKDFDALKKIFFLQKKNQRDLHTGMYIYVCVFTYTYV